MKADWECTSRTEPIEQINPLGYAAILHIVQLAIVPADDDQRLLRLFLSNGESGLVNLTREMNGPGFGSLFEFKCFANAALYPLFRIVTWHNGIDFAPEFLLDLLRRQDGRAL